MSSRDESMLRATRALRAVEWSKTLHLPKSTLPPRPPLNTREATALRKQCTEDLYAWQLENRPADNPFTLHDGPPYANGSLHIGHALNKIHKDIICRFQLSRGKRVHYVPGWDCHGLPIELKALQSQEGNHESMSPLDVRKAASKLAGKTVAEQMKGFQEWGVMGDWEHAYKTMSQDFEVRQLRVFKDMVQKGLVYRQYKPVHWSPSSGTALAEAELEYDDNHESLAAYVGFRLTHFPPAFKAMEDALGDSIYLLIWTTTPWTLPANSAIAVHNDLEYCLASLSGFHFIVAAELLPQIAQAVGQETPPILAKFPGSFLAERCQYIPSFCNSSGTAQPVLHADFVSGGSGTGLVHMAAGHGFDDYRVCQQYGLPITAPVDDAGCFVTKDHPNMPPELDGISVLKEGSQAVLDYMRTQQNPGAIDWLVLATHKYQHKYPIDWRTKEPVITRATSQWFADAGVLQEPALQALKSVTFVPESGRARLESFTASRAQWCISRQRAWGVPIPALFRQKPDGTAEAIMTAESVEHIIATLESRGSNAWWTDEPSDPAWISPSLPAGTYTRGRDTMDVWFDSGTTWTSLPNAHGPHPPADIFFEGTDQHRGWFQSSLLTHVASQLSTNPSTGLLKPPTLPPHAPFRTLITHGFILDQHARKMSKSLGNVISPTQIMDGSLLPPLNRKGRTAPDALGPDLLRLWAASADYTRDVPLGLPALASTTTTLHKLRVTLKYLLGVLAPLSPTTPLPPLPSLHTPPLLPESTALHALASTQSAIHAAYASHEPHRAIALLSRYTAALSSSYLESAKDPLYAGTAATRAAAHAVTLEVLAALLAMLAPVTPMLVQEALAHAAPGLRAVLEEPARHPFHRVWDAAGEAGRLVEGGKGVPVGLEKVGETVRGLQERARGRKMVGSGLECRVELGVGEGVLGAWVRGEGMGEGLRRLWVVSAVEMEQGDGEEEEGWREEAVVQVEGEAVRVRVAGARGAKCARCWQWVARVGEEVCARCREAVRE